MEYVAGPIIALLLGMKFTDWKTKEQIKKLEKTQDELISLVEVKMVENTKQVSQQTLKMMMPMAKSVTAINNQLGL